MRQHEAVIRVMEENGGYATLGYLYQNVLKVKGCEWKTKTPFASIRRIVQDEKFFFKIKPGLWALKSYKNSLPFEIPSIKASESIKEEFNHSYYQGLLAEIGNLNNFETFVPGQDKNRNFLGRKLSEIVTIKDFYRFSYDRIVNRAKTVDVSWFNIRKMPEALFEIEHSTDFINSLHKFMELRDFNTSFNIVADEARKREFESKISSSSFLPISKRIKFISYDKLVILYEKTCSLANIRNEIGL